MTIIFFGTYNTKSHPRIQVMIDGLRAHGVEVRECNVPLPVNTAGRVAVLRQPWRLPLFLATMLRCWIRLAFKSRGVRGGDAVIIGHMGQFDIHLAKWLFRGKPLMLDYMISGSDTAKDRQIDGGFKDRLVRWLDRSAQKHADTIILDTEEHRLALPDDQQAKGVVVNVGAPESWFNSGSAKVGTPKKPGPLRVIFFGLYTPLQGTPAIGAALALIKHPARITMIGQGQDLIPARQAAHDKADQVDIEWIDWCDADELPAVVAGHDVCLGIFGTGPKAKRVVPNKVYQGAAAGCAVVTSDTQPQRRVLGDAALFVPPGDPAALAAALDGLASDPDKLAKLRSAASLQAREHFTPGKVVTPLLEKLGLAV